VERHFAGLEANFMDAPLPDTLEVFVATLDATMNVPDEHAKFIPVFFEVFGPSFASESFTAKVAAFFERLGSYYANCIAHLQENGAIREDVDAKLFGRSLASTLDGMILHRGLFGLPKARYAKMRREMIGAIVSGVAS
ncbi:MAG: TetR family transcriptional regulator C-terminal domain-containing protein, partial [Pseudomonadota bacterium]